MSKRESELKSAFYSLMSEQSGFYMFCFTTRGAPDRLIVGNKQATFWEFKHGTPEFESPGDQELMCMRLATASYCRYVIWQERSNDKRTLIVHPQMVVARKGWILEPEAWTPGFDIKWLVRYVKGVHANDSHSSNVR